MQKRYGLKRMVKRFAFIGVIAFGLLAVTSPIVWMLVGSNHLKERVIEDVVQGSLATRVTGKGDSQSEKALKLFHFIDTHIFHSRRPANSVLNTDFLPYLIPGEAFCDEQALALMDLARKVSIKARVIYLRGYDEISHHTVLEVYLNEAFRVFDPDFGYIFYHGNNIATFSDIQQGKAVFSEKLEAQKAINKEFDSSQYFRLFEPTFGYIVSNWNYKCHFGRMIRRGMINVYYSLFGERFVSYLLDLYFHMSETPLLLRARIKHLSGSFNEAVREYNEALNHANTSFVASQALFFKGQLFWDMKNFPKSTQTLEELLELYPKHRNHEQALFYLGSSYESMGLYERAAFCYNKIPDSHTTPAPVRLVGLLNTHPDLSYFLDQDVSK